MIPQERHLQIGSLLFEGIDQIDLTGPFEVFSRIPNSTYRIFARTMTPVRDIRGLRLAADATLAEVPQLDLLHVPGGFGQEALMEDEDLLSWIRRQAEGAECVFSVCTGALMCGAAGLLKARRATTHWSAFHLLPYFGAIPVDERVVVDGKLISAGGVTAGIDGALRVAATLRGDEIAQIIQLQMQYAPEPPFHSGTPKSAPPAVLKQARRAVEAITEQRRRTAERAARRLGIELSGVENGLPEKVGFLKRLYDRFNARDMETVLAALHEDVMWANGMEGGHVRGRDGVRGYWTRQWAMVDPHVEPVGFAGGTGGEVIVEVHQVVRDLDGNVLADKMVGHIFRIEGGLVRRFDIRGE